jgi:hypothetical protein
MEDCDANGINQTVVANYLDIEFRLNAAGEGSGEEARLE